MKNTFLFILLTFLAFGCVKENFDQDNVGTIEIDTDGNDYYIKGTIDGTPFELRHSNNNQTNITGRGNWGISGQTAFQTGFYQTNPSNDLHFHVFSFQITSDTFTSTSIEDVISIGELEFWDGNIDNVVFTNGVFVYKASVGELWLGTIEFNDIRYDKVRVDPFNKCEITEFEKLDLANEPLLAGSSYDDKLYKVRGNFQSKLMSPDGAEVELIVDEFSAIIYDKKL